MSSALTQIFIDAHRRMRPRLAAPEIHAEFFPFAGLNHTIRRRSGRLSARVSDVLRDAPAEILRVVASILLARLYRQRVDASIHESYRRYILRDDIRERAHTARRERGRSFHAAAAGEHVDLDAVFDRLNNEFFRGSLPKPALAWSRAPSRRRLARYDAARRTISISRLFDSAGVPQYVTDYILFHEMLHVKYAASAGGARLVTHSSNFRAAERAFPHYEAANVWLDSALGATGTNASRENLPGVVQSETVAGVIQR